MFELHETIGNTCVDACAMNHRIEDGAKICMHECNRFFPFEVEGTGECAIICPPELFTEGFYCKLTCQSGYFMIHNQARFCVNECPVHDLVDDLR